MDRLTLRAYAKINLTLDIDGKREDGYHLLSSVFQSVTLADQITLQKAEEIALTLSDPALPTDVRNTAYRAAAAFFAATGIQGGAAVHVEKHIPQQAGMGGGSADAAGVLVGLNTLYEAGLSTRKLCEIGETIGADVPFCIVGGTALVRGIGELVTPIKALSPCFVTVAKPPEGVSTAAAYAAVDAAEPQIAAADKATDVMCRAIEKGDLAGVGKALDNAFLNALSLPQVDEVLERMRAFAPLGATMSGSGSAVFALFDAKDRAVDCMNSLRDIAQATLCLPCSCGVEIVGRD